MQTKAERIGLGGARRKVRTVMPRAIKVKPIRHLAVITGNFPSVARPNEGAFVRQLVDAFVELGVRCTVIHPWRWHHWWRERKSVRRASDNQSVPEKDDVPSSLATLDKASPRLQVYRPRTLSLSNRRIGPFSTFDWTHFFFRRAVVRTLNRLPDRPDALYGHFLYSAGEAAVRAGRRRQLPAFVAVAEGTFWTVDNVGFPRAIREYQTLTGAIAVSELLQRRLIGELQIPQSKVTVFPNGVDMRKFYPRDRAKMRQRHGLPAGHFLVAYVGNFIATKGVRRVAQAIAELAGVSGIFVGDGPLRPTIGNLAFCGRVSHSQVPELLSAADCFVLPSDVEGSSNATLEAMACGLPVIVTDAEFNQGLVEHGRTGICVAPNDIAAITAAVRRLQVEPEFRQRLGAAARAHAANRDIRQRAAGIMEWMAERAQVANL